MTGRANQ